METCLVTGCAGFIGAHLAERLLRAGHAVIGPARHLAPPPVDGDAAWRAGVVAVAERMGLSVRTVETYYSRIQAKLNLAGRRELRQHASEWVRRAL